MADEQTTDTPKVCPQCGRDYKWYENTCEDCQVALVDRPATEARDLAPVIVFETDQQGLVPLATMALDAEHIDYTIGRSGSDLSAWTRQGAWPVGGESVAIAVAAGVADRARALVADLEDPAAVEAASATAIVDHPEDAGILLENAATGASIGAVTEPQWQFVTTHFDKGETEGTYRIDTETLDELEDARAEPDLVDLLREAVGEGDEIEVRWNLS